MYIGKIKKGPAKKIQRVQLFTAYLQEPLSELHVPFCHAYGERLYFECLCYTWGNLL